VSGKIVPERVLTSALLDRSRPKGSRRVHFDSVTILGDDFEDLVYSVHEYKYYDTTDPVNAPGLTPSDTCPVVAKFPIVQECPPGTYLPDPRFGRICSELVRPRSPVEPTRWSCPAWMSSEDIREAIAEYDRQEEAELATPLEAKPDDWKAHLDFLMDQFSDDDD
jgi:hypothetical protein